MRTKTLRTALVANALFSALTGMALLVFGEPIAGWIGVGAPFVYRVLGGGLLVFAGLVGWIGTRRTVDTFRAALISLADLLWVIGTVVLILSTLETVETHGIVALLLVATVVLFFGLRQLRGIEETYRDARGSRAHVLCVEVESPVAPEELWPMVADLRGIGRYAPQLARVVLRESDASRVETIRECTDTGGRTWAERCRRFDPEERILEFDFLADEPGFPFPFGTMSGGWEVESRGSGSTVIVWFTVTPKFRPAHPFVLAMMARTLTRHMEAVVERMSSAARRDAIDRDAVVARAGTAACHASMARP
jgi:Ca2+/Na+ antiporter